MQFRIALMSSSSNTTIFVPTCRHINLTIRAIDLNIPVAAAIPFGATKIPVLKCLLSNLTLKFLIVSAPRVLSMWPTDKANTIIAVRVGIFDNATDNIRDLFIFNDVCTQYIELQVIDEVDECLNVYQTLNENMEQLKHKHNATWSKNILIGNETESREEPIPIQ